MTRIFEALKKAQSRTAALPFPPAEPPPPRPLPASRSPAVAQPPLTPRIESRPAGTLPDEVAREMAALRIGVEAALEDRRTRVVMFLGAVSGEGASTVARQFATLLAGDGRGRPLLLDAATRPAERPGRSGAGAATAGAGAPPGGIAAGRGAAPLSVAVLGDDLQRAGARGPAALRAFLTALGSQFEWVVIDGPPVLDAPDAVPLATVADGVVLVVRSGHTKRPVIQRALELLRKSGVRMLGSVLTRRRLEIPDFIYRRI